MESAKLETNTRRKSGRPAYADEVTAPPAPPPLLPPIKPPLGSEPKHYGRRVKPNPYGVPPVDEPLPTIPLPTAPKPPKSKWKPYGSQDTLVEAPVEPPPPPKLSGRSSRRKVNPYGYQTVPPPPSEPALSPVTQAITTTSTLSPKTTATTTTPTTAKSTTKKTTTTATTTTTWRPDPDHPISEHRYGATYLGGYCQTKQYRCSILYVESIKRPATAFQIAHEVLNAIGVRDDGDGNDCAAGSASQGTVLHCPSQKGWQIMFYRYCR